MEPTTVTETTETATPETNTTVLASATRDALKKAAMNLKKVAPSKATLPVLKHVLFSTHGGVLTMRATDLDVDLRLEIEGADVENEGQASCDVRALKDALTHLPDAPVHISVERDGSAAGLESLILEAGTVRMTFDSLPADEHSNPVGVGDAQNAGSVTLPVETWAALSDNLAPFVSTEESRPILNGVLFRRSNQSLDVVATNGHRMMIYEEDGPGGSKAWQAILPGSGFLGQLRLMFKRAGVEGNATLTVNENTAVLSFDGGAFSTRLIEGPYPNWEQVVPNGPYACVATLPRKAAVKAMKTLKAGYKDSDAKRTRWTLEPGATVQVSASSLKGPTVEVELEGSSVDATEPMEVAFNGAYVQDILDAHDAENVELRLTTPNRGAMLAPVEPNGWRTLLMPLRLLD